MFSSPLFPFPLGSCPIFSQGLIFPSQSTLYWFGLGFCCERGREERHAAAIWEDDGSSSLPSYLYSPSNEVGCLGLV